MRKYTILSLAIALCLFAETLFEVKDNSDNTIFSVSDDGMRVYSLGDTLMVISATGIKAFINDSKVLSRKFSVSTTSSKGGSDVFKVAAGIVPDVVDENTMLWYPQKNAFRVGKVLIQHSDSVGTNSFASGYNSQAKGNYSQAMGYETKANGTYSMAIGHGAKAMNGSATAIGQYANASGASAIALGNSSAMANSSVAIGNNSSAEGTNSTSIGYYAHASGSESFSLGPWSYANAYRTFAWGNMAKANALYSVAIGQDVEAQSYYSTVIGRNNIIAGSVDTWYPTDPLFVIGNGTSTRSNALTVLKNGNTTVDGTLTTGKINTVLSGDNYLRITSTSPTVSGIELFRTGASFRDWRIYNTGGNLKFGYSADELSTVTDIFQILYTGFVGIGSATPSQKFDVYGGNGRVETGYSWLTSSDKRFKKNITTLENPLSNLKRIRGVRYDLNEENNSVRNRGKHIGFIAQELEEIYGELVATDEKGYKAVAYDKVSAVLVEAVKELDNNTNEELGRLRKENQELKKEIENIKRILNIEN